LWCKTKLSLLAQAGPFFYFVKKLFWTDVFQNKISFGGFKNGFARISVAEIKFDALFGAELGYREIRT